MNTRQLYHDWNADYYYSAVHTAPGRKASDCLECGKCEAVCPQHLPIRQLLKDVAKEFEKKSGSPSRGAVSEADCGDSNITKFGAL